MICIPSIPAASRLVQVRTHDRKSRPFVLRLLCLLLFWVISGLPKLAAEMGKPEWVKKGKDAGLEAKGILQGFAWVKSSGKPEDDIRSAEDQAREALAKLLMVHVEGQSVDIWTEKFQGGRRETLSDVRSEVRTSVKLTLEDVGVRRWPEKPEKAKNYYALAYLDAAQAAQKLGERLQTHYKTMKDEKKLGEEALENGKIRESIIHLARARYHSLQAAAHSAHYLILRRETNPSLEELAGGEFSHLSPESLWAELLHGLRLQTAGGERQKVAQGQLPEHPLLAQLTLHYRDKEQPAMGIPVRFSLLNAEGVIQAGVPIRTRGLGDAEGGGTGQATSSIATDKEGKVTCQVLSLTSKNGAIQTVTATIDVDSLIGELTEVEPGLLRRWVSPLVEQKAVFVFEEPSLEELSLEQWVARQVRRLTAQPGWPKQAKVLVGAFTYRDSLAAGELGRQLSALFRTALADAGITVLKTDPHGVSALLRGEYWEDEKQVEVRMFLEDSADKQLAAISAFVSREKVSALALKPGATLEEFNKFQDAMADVSDPKISPLRGFAIKVWTDRGSSPLYHNGEEMTIYLQSTQDCHVRLLYVTADGKSLLIFPNRWGGDDFLKAGEKLELPGKMGKFRFVTQPPFGPEILKVIASAYPMMMPGGKELDGAVLLTESSLRTLTRGLRGVRVEAVSEEQGTLGPPGVAEHEIVINSAP